MKRRFFAFCLCLVMLLSCCGCSLGGDSTAFDGDPIGMADISAAIEQRGGYALRAAVLYDGSAQSTAWETTLDYLRQPTVLGLSAEAVDVSAGYELGAFDLIFLDESLLSAAQLGDVIAAVTAFTENGGYVFLPNAFCSAFPAEYLGIEKIVPLKSYPARLQLPDVPGDLKALQTLIADYHNLYKDFADAKELRHMDYGCGVKVSTACPLVRRGSTALYTLNRCGRGAVLLANPLLPNAYSKGAFSLAAEEGQTSFSNTTASCNQMFLSDFAAYVFQQIYGFALNRVFGAYGSPAMSWELHYEDITSIEHDSLGQFIPILKDHRQVPSLALVRDTYTWFEEAETLAYALNQGSAGEFRFALDRDESAYSSGTHIAVDSQWLKLNELADGGSYFEDYPKESYRLTPCVLDYDGDGNPDAFCGSSDGCIYFFRGLGFSGTDGRLCMEKAQPVAGVSVSAYSAPALSDLDGDGYLDLVVGGVDGRLYCFKGQGDLNFTPQGVLLSAGAAGQCLPSFGDVNGDGVTDLALGSYAGTLNIYYGESNGSATEFSSHRTADLSGLCADAELGKWLAPCLADVNGDGRTDLAVGTYDGYVAIFLCGENGEFGFDGFITAEDMNYKGNSNLKFGHFCTPAFCDLDGNGSPDLACGYEEYGMVYPIDNDYFPFRAQLQQQVDNAIANDYYIGVHFMSGTYFSADREAYELARHIEALRDYGVENPKGANQHTWYMSSFDEAQSLLSIWNAGLMWESGYAPAKGTSTMPQYSAENVIAMPFYLMHDGERTLLVQNCSVLPYCGSYWTDISGKYGMPLLVYYHCDMIYKSDAGAKDAAAQVEEFQKKFGYNFVMEDQLMYGIAAAYNLTVDVQPADNGFSIVPGAAETDFALFDEDYQSAAGVRIDFSCALTESAGTDAAVWTRDGTSLSIGLDRVVRVFGEDGSGENHILRVNTPADIELTGSGAVLSFQSCGMQQVAVSGKAETSDEGWSVETVDGSTVFTAYEKNPVLHLTF